MSFFDDYNERLADGMVYHVTWYAGSLRHERIILKNDYEEVTVFEGHFQNMASDHEDISSTFIIVGHHDLKHLHIDAWGNAVWSQRLQRFVTGIVSFIDYHGEKFRGDRELTEKAVNGYVFDYQWFVYHEGRDIDMDIDYRSTNKNAMDDTQMLCGNLDVLRKSIENSIAKEYVVYQGDELSLKPVTANKDMKVIVSKERTYQAAWKYKGKKVCCLDFANCYSIGGAPWSAGAQEESMCRCSTLYPCLCARKQDFYEKHIREDMASVIDYMGSDDLIFIPGVTVFKSDESEPKLMPEHEWYDVDVIVAAAPELDWDSEEPGFRKVMEQRIKRILDVVSREGEEVLVLGAFGCGAFRNPPEVVADIFASLIRGYDFETVEFAVFCRDSETKNYSVFKAAMEGVA